MSEMIVQVRNKMLRRIGGVNHFVSHNKDYTIQFQFDESWDNVRTKMAVFAYEDGEYGSEIFDGDTCNVPELPREGRILIGVKAGEDLSTELLCIPVCKSADDVITDEYDEPDPKIYEQILDIINNLWNGGTTVYPSPVKFLASPNAAKVGDLIRVKEVDENGDVTRTEGFDVGVELGKKIDAPQTAAVGEVLTVEEIGKDSKPKRWKTAPGVNITTELTHESTDTQVPSAKAVGDAIEKKIDKNQGTENAGKILGIGKDGNVVPEDKPVQALAGAAAPTAATAGVVGQEYYVIEDNAVTEMYVCTSALIGSYTWDKVEFGGGTSNAVQYTEQSLTDTQKQQARTNIGAGTSSFSGSYNDLTNTPIPDTTLKQSGKPADAKAVGEALDEVTDVVTTFGSIKVDKSQGTANAGKYLGINSDGNVTVVDAPSGGADKSLGITSATVGQIAKITAVDATGKPTAWEPVDMPTVLSDYELVFQETVAEDAALYMRDRDKDGNPFSLTDVMVVIFTKPFAESTNSAGRGLGFLPTSGWGFSCVSCNIGDSISSANANSVGRYNVVFAKVVNGYQVVTRAYVSQNETNVFGSLIRQTSAANEMFSFHSDATKLMQIKAPQGNITCVRIVGYTQPLVSKGTIIALYKKKGT